MSGIKIFEKNNLNVSVNIYGIKQEKTEKSVTHVVFPLNVNDRKKSNYFDLLLISENDNIHYTFISNFSRLIRSQKTQHTGAVVFCKRCFTLFDEQPKKILSGQAALDHQYLPCLVG